MVTQNGRLNAFIVNVWSIRFHTLFAARSTYLSMLDFELVMFKTGSISCKCPTPLLFHSKYIYRVTQRIVFQSIL